MIQGANATPSPSNEQDALDPGFVKETGLNAIVMYTSSDRAPKKNAAWMTSDEKIQHTVVVRDEIDDDDQGDTSWAAFCDTLSTLLDFVTEAQRVS